MQKNPGENFTTIEVDPINGDYYIRVPEWMMNEFEWYEGTTVNMEMDKNCIIVSELGED